MVMVELSIPSYDFEILISPWLISKTESAWIPSSPEEMAKFPPLMRILSLA
jgi:hypothetical protein